MLRVEPATAEDMPRCMAIVNQAFGFSNLVVKCHGEDTPENRVRVGKVHYKSQEDHMQRFPSVPVCVKCTLVTTSPSSGAVTAEEIVGYGEWYVADRERTDEELGRLTYIESFGWVAAEDDRAELVSFGVPGRALRKRVLGRRAFGQLRFLAVEETHRRKGAGSAVVRWGMDRCAELGVPAYLESSTYGAGMYERLGFEKLPIEEGEGASLYASMMWHPSSA